MATTEELNSMRGIGITPVALVDSTGSITSGAAVSGNVASGATDSGNPIKIGGVANTAPGAVTAGQRVNGWFGLNGQFMAAISGGAGTAGSDGANQAAILTQSSTGITAPVGVALYRFNGTAWDRDSYATTVSRIMSAAATTNPTSAKASAGKLFRISGLNAAAAVRYVKVYNKASAPTVGADTPILTLACAASVPFVFDLAPGVYFSTGIAYALTTGAPDADTGALTLADILGLNVIYA